MAKKHSPATETELSILDVLWSRGPSSIRDIVEALYGEHRPALHATVKSLLERLADKGYVASERSGFAHTFAAQVDRESYVGRQLQALADSHFQGSLTPMLMALVERIELGSGQRDAIRKIIDHMSD